MKINENVMGEINKKCGDILRHCSRMDDFDWMRFFGLCEELHMDHLDAITFIDEHWARRTRYDECSVIPSEDLIYELHRAVIEAIGEWYDELKECLACVEIDSAFSEASYYCGHMSIKTYQKMMKLLEKASEKEKDPYDKRVIEWFISQVKGA